MQRSMKVSFFIPLALLACRQTDITKFEEPSIEEIAEVDQDGDGFYSNDDCDDLNSLINPNAEEICDGADNNCDGQIDEAVTSIFYQDNDADGFGDPELFVEACDPQEGYVGNGSDCDDSTAEAYPGGTEICDGIDNDCNQEIDEKS